MEIVPLFFLPPSYKQTAWSSGSPDEKTKELNISRMIASKGAEKGAIAGNTREGLDVSDER